MKAEILATGDEIRTGALIDSNSAYIAEKLEEIGIEVTRHSCVGDDMNALVAIIEEISQRADVAIVTGGLGPTTDDLTSEAFARAAGIDLEKNPLAMTSIEDFFKLRKRPLNKANKKQAYLPVSADCLLNPYGTAPGFSLKIGKCTFYCLPGVPFEMRRMLAEKVMTAMTGLGTGVKDYRLVKSLSTFGLTESVTSETLAGFEQTFPEVKLGLRAKFPDIQVKLYVSGQDKELLQALLEKAADWVADRIGNRVISRTGQPIEVIVGQLLRKRDATLAVAESCTGGLIASQLTDVAGSSDYFLFSGVTYSNEAKIKILGVAPGTIEKYGAVSEETAREMAEGARRACGAIFGLSTSGIAGPSGGSAEKPVGTVCIGLATPDGSRGYRFNYTYGTRAMHKQIFAMKAIDLLRRELLGISKN